MKPHVVALGVLVVGGALFAACGDEDGDQPSVTSVDPASFQAEVDNPFFPLIFGQSQVYEGEESDAETGETIELRIESTVLSETDIVAGVEVTVVEVKDFEDGELVESTLDYYAQHEDGTVYYLGETVDEYEDGEIVGHGGQWLAGEGDNQAGVFMPAEPQVGDEFEQERAPGVAEDQSKVVAVDEAATTAAGSFSGCIKTEDFDPLDDVTEFKYYCPDVGLVREEPPDGFVDLISYAVPEREHRAEGRTGKEAPWLTRSFTSRSARATWPSAKASTRRCSTGR